MLVCVSLCASCTRDRGCSVHPAFPAPSFFLGEKFMHDPGASRRGIAKVYLEFHVIASEAKQSISPRKGRMDCFVATLLAMTGYSFLRHAPGRHHPRKRMIQYSEAAVMDS